MILKKERQKYFLKYLKIYLINLFALKIHRYSSKEGGTYNLDLVNSYFKESPSQYELVGKLIKSNRLPDVVDFDEHFQNSQLDWRNSFIDSYIGK